MGAKCIYCGGSYNKTLLFKHMWAVHRPEMLEARRSRPDCKSGEVSNLLGAVEAGNFEVNEKTYHQRAALPNDHPANSLGETVEPKKDFRFMPPMPEGKTGAAAQIGAAIKYYENLLEAFGRTRERPKGFSSAPIMSRPSDLSVALQALIDTNKMMIGALLNLTVDQGRKPPTEIQPLWEEVRFLRDQLDRKEQATSGMIQDAIRIIAAGIERNSDKKEVPHDKQAG